MRIVPARRDWFHKMQNVTNKLHKKDGQKVPQGLRQLYGAPTRRRAERHYLRWATRWQEQYPSAVAWVQKDLPELLAIFDVPAEHRPWVRTTNPIERCFHELRRRTRSMGPFMNHASIEWIVYGLLAYMNRKYAERVARCCKRMVQAA